MQEVVLNEHRLGAPNLSEAWTKICRLRRDSVNISTGELDQTGHFQVFLCITVAAAW